MIAISSSWVSRLFSGAVPARTRGAPKSRSKNSGRFLPSHTTRAPTPSPSAAIARAASPARRSSSA